MTTKKRAGLAQKVALITGGECMQSAAGRSILHFQCAIEVVLRLDIIRFQAEGFLELADRLVGLAFPAKGDAEVVVGLA